MNSKFKRDQKSKAIINMDYDAFKSYQAQRDEFYKIESVKDDVNNLKNDISEIKQLLQKIANNG